MAEAEVWAAVIHSLKSGTTTSVLLLDWPSDYRSSTGLLYTFHVKDIYLALYVADDRASASYCLMKKTIVFNF